MRLSLSGLGPSNLRDANGPLGRARELGRIGRRLRHGSAKVAVVVVSHITLADGGFRDELRRIDCAKLLIADEVHNLGSEGFIADAPDFFEYRLGLSATPVRQYDHSGTEALFDFIGPVVYQFTLEEAIGKCLVPYDYHVHTVDLTSSEMYSWHEITNRNQSKTHGVRRLGRQTSTLPSCLGIGGEYWKPRKISCRPCRQQWNLRDYEVYATR